MSNIKLSAVDKKIREHSKFRWITKASWRKLSRGEKVVRVIIKTAKFALIGAAVVGIGSIVIGVALGIEVAMGIVGAISGGFESASRTNTNRFYGHYKW